MRNLSLHNLAKPESFSSFAQLSKPLLLDLSATLRLICSPLLECSKLGTSSSDAVNIDGWVQSVV